MRLLDALNNAKLEVPANVIKVEADLKKEFAAADRKARALYKASLAAPTQSETLTGVKKRKLAEATNCVNVNITFGNHGLPPLPTLSRNTNNQVMDNDIESGPKKRSKKIHRSSSAEEG